MSRVWNKINSKANAGMHFNEEYKGPVKQQTQTKMEVEMRDYTGSMNEQK